MTTTCRSVAAARAWRALHGESLDANRIVLVRESRDSTVFRLSSRCGSIIAKRCPSATGKVERTIYEHFLSRLAVPTLHYYGALQEPDCRFCWLFVEDAEGHSYEAHRDDHSAAAARWLAELHRAVGSSHGPEALPERRPNHYRQLLKSAVETLGDLRPEPGSTQSDRRVELDTVIAHCKGLSEAWPVLEQACEGSRDTLVHGDIVSHNARLRGTPDGLLFLPFDWEKAGWGSPAEDLSSVDLDAYCDAVAVHRQVSKATVRRLAGAGKVFRCLVYLEWLGPDLAAGSAEAFEQLVLCRSWLDAIIPEQPWIK